MTKAVLCQTARMNYGQRVRFERERRGWTREQLAEKINASAGTVKNLENADTAPVGSRFTLAVESVLGVRTSEVDPTDPPLSQASDMLLVSEVARRLAASQSVIDSPVMPDVEIRGVPLGSEQAKPADGS